MQTNKRVNRRIRANPPVKQSLSQLQKREVSDLISRRLIKNEEMKYVDTNIGTAVAVSSTPTITCLNLLAQGNNASNRIGNQVRIMRIECRVVSVVGDATQVMRFVLVWDKQPNGALALEADLFSVAGQPISLRNNDKIKRFDFLYDKQFSLDTNDSVKVLLDVNTRVNRISYYNGTTGLISNITTGALLLYQISDSGAVPHPTQGVALRVYFLDA